MTQPYDKAVTTAAKALATGDTARWELARLTYNHTKGPGGPADGVSLAQWAADVQAAGRLRFGKDTAGRYRRIWERYVDTDAADRPTWTEAYYAVIESLEANKARRVTKPNTPEEKVEAYRELANDPVVKADPTVKAHMVETVAKDPGLTLQTMTRHDELHPKPERPARRATGWDYIIALAVGASAKLRAQALGEDVEKLVQWCRDHRPLEEGAREAVEANVTKLREASEVLRRYAAEIELAIGQEVRS